MDALRAKGHSIDTVTLHVGLGTFKPVTATDVRNHDIHTEEVLIDQAIFGRITEQKQQSRPLVAVGTTVCRTLESLPYVRILLKEQGADGAFSQTTREFRDRVSAGISLLQAQTIIPNYSHPDVLLMRSYDISFSTKIFIFP